MRTNQSFVAGMVLVISLAYLNGCAPLMFGTGFTPASEHSTIQSSEVRADSVDRTLSMEEQLRSEYYECLDHWANADYCVSYLYARGGAGMPMGGYTFGLAPGARQAAEMQMLRIHIAEGEQTDWRQNQAISAILARIAAGEAVTEQMRRDLEALGVRVDVVEGEAARALVEAERAGRDADAIGKDLRRTQEVVVMDGDAQDEDLSYLRRQLERLRNKDEDE